MFQTTNQIYPLKSMEVHFQVMLEATWEGFMGRHHWEGFMGQPQLNDDGALP
jgi:hypothetical protein